MKFYLESLGCARNLVDSEIMTGRLLGSGWHQTWKPEKADTIIVNTCSFIESAINESIDSILALAENKKTGTCRRLIVTGCLPERFRQELAGSLPEVDLFLGTGAFDRIVTAATDQSTGGLCILPDPDDTPVQRGDSPRAATTPHTAYIKIAEGCSRKCTYCIIPRLRGRQKSRTVHDIVAEATYLLKSGVRELNLVAQDTTAFGRDLVPPSSLAVLLDTLAGLRLAQEPADMAKTRGPGAGQRPEFWIRFLYGHPQSMTDAVVETVSAFPNLCPYFDIPIQHASGPVLKKMGRSYDTDDLKRQFENIRSIIPDVALRTTVMVGFPGETDQDFETLISFINTIRFDHLGVFRYSDAEDLPSHRLEHHIEPEVARMRYDRIMKRQQEISKEKLRKYRGRKLDVLIEEKIEEGLYSSRSTFQAPEVDGMTYVKATGAGHGNVAPGDFKSVRITDTLEYDLIGEPE
jgi:ribosomal protein S12 methylthiotransferase